MLKKISIKKMKPKKLKELTFVRKKSLLTTLKTSKHKPKWYKKMLEGWLE